jgi:CoA:oxalate CoA-transferase
MTRILEGVRVLELTNAFNGPLAGRILGELGAEVIKIEPPWGSARDFLPIVSGESFNFIMINCNKKFITLNLKTEAGKELFKKLVKVSDVVLENFSAGTMERLGLGYDELKKLKPDIIYVSSSGFGHRGKYVNLPAYDYIVEAMSGLYSLTGEKDLPMKYGVAIIDVLSGVFAALATVAALYNKMRTGKGERADMAMYDNATYAMMENVAGVLIEGKDSKFNQRLGNKHPVTAPYALYRASDNFVFIAVAKDEQFARLCKVMNREDLIKDPRFSSNEARVRNMEELDQIIQSWVEKYPAKTVVKLLLEADVAAAEVRSLFDALNDSNVEERKLLVELVHPILGNVKVLNSVLKFENADTSVYRPGMPLGYDNEYVYSNILGLSKEEIERLRQENVI